VNAARPTSRVFTILDVAGTVLFAAEGARAGILAHLDLFGVLVVALSTALVGGVIRDLLLGDTPPAAFRSPLRIVAALLGGGLTFAAFAVVGPGFGPIVDDIDAAALALFAVSGAEKAWEFKANGWTVVFLGTITAVGGGVVRDVLLNRIPFVLTQSVYATAALAGALVYYLCRRFGLANGWALALGFVVAFALRLLALLLGLSLPVVQLPAS
jgi:uncharacterized membrane protein YeiH